MQTNMNRRHAKVIVDYMISKAMVCGDVMQTVPSTRYAKALALVASDIINDDWNTLIEDGDKEIESKLYKLGEVIESTLEINNRYELLVDFMYLQNQYLRSQVEDYTALELLTMFANLDIYAPVS